MATKRYCDFHGCGELLATDGLRAKVRRGPGKLAGLELDVCGSHAIELERFILGRPDDASPPTARPRAPRKPRPTRPSPEAA